MAENVTRRFNTTGLHCPSCSMLVQMSVGDLDGVQCVQTDHRSGITEVVYDPALVTDEAIIAEIVKAGYGATPLND